MYDGISGLVTQPINGAMNEGVAGLIKGIGKGIGGVVLKPPAGRLSIDILINPADLFQRFLPFPDIHSKEYTRKSKSIWARALKTLSLRHVQPRATKSGKQRLKQIASTSLHNGTHQILSFEIASMRKRARRMKSPPTASSQLDICHLTSGRG